MSRADAYLQKAALRGRLIQQEPLPGCRIIVCIPVYNESGLERCLDSLFLAAGPPEAPSTAGAPATEVLIFINAPAGAPAAALEQNLRTLDQTRAWITAHPHPRIRFHVWLDHSFEPKEAGVGTARKILMDEAVRRADVAVRRSPDSVICSLDADVVVAPNYLEALNRHFFGERAGPAFVGGKGGTAPEGCSIRFEHPLGPEDSQGTDVPSKRDDPPVAHQCNIFPPRTYHAIALYELHLRYYLHSVRSTGYPHAFHTVGSAFAVRADIYCQEGGMNRRQGGEDFYFIQKVAQRGGWSECNETCVYPSPRPSDRVPFGTGPVVARLLDREKDPDVKSTLYTYNPQPFTILREFFKRMDELYEKDPKSENGQTANEQIPNDPVPAQDPLSSFLIQQDFETALREIRSNSASLPTFRKRFWRWFNMFRIMKFLHYARENGYPDVPVEQASKELLFETGTFNNSVDSTDVSAAELLRIFRDRQF